MTVRQLLTPEQASKVLAISVKQLRDLTHEGLIPFVNIGLGAKRPTRRYLPEDIDLFISRRRMEARRIDCTSTRRTPLPMEYHVVDFAEIRAKLKEATERERRKAARRDR